MPSMPQLPVPLPAAVSSSSYDILQAFFYGRAFAITLSKRLGEAVVDAVAEVSRAAAERPQRLKDFQDEVAALARKEMADASVPERAGSSGGGGGADGSSTGTSEADVQALVDDLRAEIAYSRAILQQMRTGGKSGAPPGPPPA